MLVSNAIRFTPAGGQITLLAARLDSGGISVTVADTGCGMESDAIAVALTPFAQLDSGRNRSRNGIGLGLALTKGLAALHDGGLELRSAPGEGTTATLTFPAARVDDANNGSRLSAVR
jgi:two-component system cell cycle sensor histidine kinase PleC